MVVVHLHLQRSPEQSVVAVDVDRPQQDVALFLNYIRDIVDDAHVVGACYAQRNGIAVVSFAAPFSLYDPVAEAPSQLRSVGAVCTVDFYSATDCNKSENLVAVKWVAALRQRVVDTFYLLANGQYIAVALSLCLF